jgi:hypothetical protein
LIDGPRPAPERRGAAAALVLLAAAIGVRVVLYRDFPAVLTNDAWDYLRAATDIRDRLDYFSPGLRDVRMPGYPTLLALTMPVTHLHSDGIMRLQAAFGVATVALGWAIGRLVGSRVVSLALMVFLGLGPVSLLNEHTVMPEAFSLFLYVAVVATGLASLRPGARWPSVVGFGLALGLATLTRANIVVLGAVIAGGMWIVDRGPHEGGGRWLANAVRRLRRPLVAGIVATVVIAPWLWRNAVAYGRPSLYSSTNSNVLLYKAMHAPLDGSTPELARVNRILGWDRVDFQWQQRLQAKFPSRKAERLSRRILREQIKAHPWRHLADVAESAAGLVGFNFTYGNERAALRWWFRTLAGDVDRTNRMALESKAASVIPGWTFVPAAGDTRATRLFARLGDAYLVPGRAIAFVAFFALLGFYAMSPASRGGSGAGRPLLVAIVATAYAGTLALHAVMLTDYDRYATMFDFVAVLIAALVVDDVVAARRAAERDRVSAPGAVTSSRVPAEEPVAAPTLG